MTEEKLDAINKKLTKVKKVILPEGKLFVFKQLTENCLAFGETESGETVKGYLSILSFPYENIEPGFYISNKEDSPFAFKIKPESLFML